MPKQLPHPDPPLAKRLLSTWLLLQFIAGAAAVFYSHLIPDPLQTPFVLTWLAGWLLLGIASYRLTPRHVPTPNVDYPHCPDCGYDLRATPTHCPECGRPTGASADHLTHRANRQLQRIAASVGATELAVFSIHPIPAPPAPLTDRFETLLHIRPDDADADTCAAAITAFKDIIRPCVAQTKDGVIDVGPLADNRTQYCIVTLATHNASVIGAAAFIVPCRSEATARQALQKIRRAGAAFGL